MQSCFFFMYVHHILIDCLFAKQVKSIIFDKNTETAYNQYVPPMGGIGAMQMEQKNRKETIRLLQTARGQIDAILRMMEEGRYCIDISNQILATQALLKKANAQVLTNHLQTCVKDSIENHTDYEQKLTEIEEVIRKLVR